MSSIQQMRNTRNGFGGCYSFRMDKTCSFLKTSVKTWIEQSLIGDMHVETEYQGYRDFGGVEVVLTFWTRKGLFLNSRRH